MNLPILEFPLSSPIMLDIIDNERTKEKAIIAKKRLGMNDKIVARSLLGGFKNTVSTLCWSEISTSFSVSNGEILAVNWISISVSVATTVLMSGLK